MSRSKTPKAVPQNCGAAPQQPTQTLTDLVNHYIAGKRKWRQVYADSLVLKKGAPVDKLWLKDVYDLCVYGLHYDNKRRLFVPMECHQRRIANWLPYVVDKLRKPDVFQQKFATFEALYDYVVAVANSVRVAGFRFGPVAKYDVASRLAVAIPAPAPKDYVYFHAGALDGIKNLYQNAGLPRPKTALATAASYTIRYANLVAIPQFAALKKLTAGEIEDLCCVHSEDLKTILLS